MPNWCLNRVTFTHEDSEQIKKIETAFKSETGLFKAFFPIPDGYEKSGDWYEWCNANWGTKWDVREDDSNYIVDDEHDSNHIELDFETAWSPPIAFYQSMLALGFGITAYYFEPGMCFTGSWKNGVDDCYDGETSNIEKAFPAELVEMFGIKEWYNIEEDEETQSAEK